MNAKSFGYFVQKHLVFFYEIGQNLHLNIKKSKTQNNVCQKN